MKTEEEVNNNRESDLNKDSIPNPYVISIHGWLKVFLILLLGGGVMALTISWISLKDCRLNYDTLQITEEEREQIINTLLQYSQPTDSVYIQQAIANGQEFCHTLEETDSFRVSYLRNMAHIDSVVIQGCELAKQNEAERLLLLLEKEKKNFYLHPNNLLDNEIALHQLFILLYNKFYDEENAAQYYAKIISLAECTKSHILMIQMFRGGEIHPYYPEVLHNLVELYGYVDKNDKAIAQAKELCKCYEQLGYKGEYVQSLMQLSDLYEAVGLQTQRDSCEKILETSPIYQEFLKSQERSLR